MSGPRAVLVGYGHAGHDLHHRSLVALGRADELTVVDPVRPAPLTPGTRWVPDLDTALAGLPDVPACVFHVVTPVDQHLPVVRRLMHADARHVIVEKPITDTVDAAVEMSRWADRVRAVGVWPASRITRRVTELLAAGRIGRPVTLHMDQSKPRFRRSATDTGHRSVFDVELPHQVLLALHIAGEVDGIEAVRSWESPLPRGLGGAEMVLRHAGGVTSTLRSDLTAPVRTRRLRVTGTLGAIVADYALGSDDDHGQVRVDGEAREVLPDAPLTRFIDQAYEHAAGRGPAPGPVAEHVTVIRLLDRARSLCTKRRAIAC